MKSILNFLVAGTCNVFGLALLVLSATAGGSAVRAADPSTLQNVLFDPIAKIVMAVEQRVADLETTVAAFARSFTSERIVAQQLCIADASGVQTCVTKAQFDALLKGAAQGNHTAANDQPEVHAGESGMSLPVVAVEMPPAVDQPVAAIGEATNPMPEVSSAGLPATEQLTAATGESGKLPAVATVTLSAVEPVIAAGTKREADTPTEQPAKDEELAHSGSLTANPTAPALNAVPVQEPPAPDRLE